MEGFRVFTPAEWEKAGVDGTTFALQDLKGTLEGLAKRLFGEIKLFMTFRSLHSMTFYEYGNPCYVSEKILEKVCLHLFYR